MLSYFVSSASNGDVGREDGFGELRCFARNELGESEKPCVFRLIAAGKDLIRYGILFLPEALIK